MRSFLMIAVPLTVIGTGLVYMFALCFINENNAKTWLSGYNTMSKAEQEKFDLKGYLGFFKSFLYNLGVYGTLSYFLLFFMTDEQFAMWTWICLLYTSPRPRDHTRSRMPSSA